MPKAKDNNNKKESKHFFKELRAELKKVIWPTPKQLANNTVAVITIVLITAVLVFALDFTFRALSEQVLTIVEANQEKSENQEDANTITNVMDENNTETNSEAADNNETTGSEQENVVE